VVVCLQVVDDMLPVSCQDIASCALQTLIHLDGVLVGDATVVLERATHIGPGSGVQLSNWSVSLRRELFIFTIQSVSGFLGSFID
jgi:hypothetical protein